MSETPFEKFISLVQVDQSINALHVQIQSLESHNKEQQKLEQTQATLVEKAKQKLHDIKKEVDGKELEMKVLDEQEADKKKRLETVANHKEYQSLKAEVDRIKKAQHDLEEGLITVWNQLETAKKEYEVAKQQYEKQHAQIEEQRVKNSEKIAELNQNIASLMQDRQSKEQAVPAEWLEKYATMRARVTDPVVPVINGDCSACFYQVSTQDMQQLRHRKLLQCKDCFRLLYLPEVQGNI